MYCRYFYGRGVSDNKGPLLAFAHTASKLLMMHQLDVDLVMLIEGEEETGSKSLIGIVRQHKVGQETLPLFDLVIYYIRS
jgi:di- and tripeptidase